MIVLNQILTHQVNAGYGSEYNNRILDKVNDKKIRNIKTLVDTIENNTEDYLKYY